MKVLVTGATGRVGANLIKQLSERGHETRAMVLPGDKMVDKLKPFNAEVFVGDFVKYEDCVRAVEGVDAVVHLGAYFPQPWFDEVSRKRTQHDVDMMCFEVNVRGTFNMLEATHEHCPRCKRFVFASSDAPYFPKLYSPTDEEHPVGLRHRAKSASVDVLGQWSGMYTTSKVIGEDMCVEYYARRGLPTVRARFALQVGPDEVDHLCGWLLKPMLDGMKAQPNKSEEVLQQIGFLEKSLAAGKTLVLSATKEGKTTVNHICDPRDTAHGLICMIESDNAPGEVFNIAGPSPYSLGEAVPYAAKAYKTNYVKITVPDVEYSTLSISKARNLIGFNPKYDIFKMIDDSAALKRGEDIGMIVRRTPQIL